MKKYLVIIVLFFMGVIQSFAETTVPHVFESGDIIKAEEMNENFNQLSVAIDTEGEMCSKNIKTTTEEHDYNKDGNVDYRTKSEYTYYKDGSKKGIVYEQENNADGVVNKKRVITYTKNSDGTRTYKTEQDNNGNGIMENIVTITYDLNGRKIFDVSEEDNNEDGKIDRRISETQEYDDEGNIKSRVKEIFKLIQNEDGTETEKNETRTTTFTRDTTYSLCNKPSGLR